MTPKISRSKFVIFNSDFKWFFSWIPHLVNMNDWICVCILPNRPDPWVCQPAPWLQEWRQACRGQPPASCSWPGSSAPSPSRSARFAARTLRTQCAASRFEIAGRLDRCGSRNRFNAKDGIFLSLSEVWRHHFLNKRKYYKIVHRWYNGYWPSYLDWRKKHF